MSQTAAQIGKGVALAFQSSSTSAFVTVAEILDIKMPKYTASPVTIQRSDAPSLFEELISGWAKGGDCEIEATYNSSQGAALYGLFNRLVTYQVSLPAPFTDTRTYVAIMSEFGDEIPIKTEMKNDFKFSISGPPVNSAASA